MPWLTPEDAMTEYAVLVLRIPHHKQARAQLRGFLLDCCDPEQYENEYGISELDAAAEWEQALTDEAMGLECDDL
jgi:hypothetical protein